MPKEKSLDEEVCKLLFSVIEDKYDINLLTDGDFPARIRRGDRILKKARELRRKYFGRKYA